MIYGPRVFIGNRLRKNCGKMALFSDNHFILLYFFILPKKSRSCCLFGLDLHFSQFVIWELSLINCIFLFVFICNWSSRLIVLSSRISTSNISCVDKKKLVETSCSFKWENLTNFLIVCKKNNLVSSFSFTQLFVKYSVKYLVRLIYF